MKKEIRQPAAKASRYGKAEAALVRTLLGPEPPRQLVPSAPVLITAVTSDPEVVILLVPEIKGDSDD
jgi:hypothetical protein